MTIQQALRQMDDQDRAARRKDSFFITKFILSGIVLTLASLGLFAILLEAGMFG